MYIVYYMEKRHFNENEGMADGDFIKVETEEEAKNLVKELISQGKVRVGYEHE